MWIVFLTFFTALGVAGAVLLIVPGRFDAIATASIDPGNADPLTGNAGSTTVIGLVQGNLISLVESERVALAVVKQLNLAADAGYQEGFRESKSFGRMPIETWIADSLLNSIDAKFAIGTNVLTVKAKSGSPLRSALVANAFLTSTIDAAIEMKAAAAEQTARWFGPQIDAARAELSAARAELLKYQHESSMVLPLSGGDADASKLMSVTQELSNAKANLTVLQSRYASASTDLSMDPSDPDLQLLSGLKSKASSVEADIDLLRASLGANNPKVTANMATLKSVNYQIDEAVKKMREHLRSRIDALKAQIESIEQSRKIELKEMIGVQAEREKLAELQRNVEFRRSQLDNQEKAASQARLESKLNFSGIAVLDKATPPVTPAFPKPFVVLAVAIGAGLSLGLILALLAEALDRRIRFPEDLAFATSARLLGAVPVRKTRPPRLTRLAGA